MNVKRKIMKKKLKELIINYSKEKIDILKKRPDLEKMGDFSPEGVKLSMINLFLEQLRSLIQENKIETLSDDVFSLANRLSIEGYGDEAVNLHNIHNKIVKEIQQ